MSSKSITSICVPSFSSTIPSTCLAPSIYLLIECLLSIRKMDADSLKDEGISLHLERKGIGFVHAPRVHPDSTEVAHLPGWIRKVIDAWQPISRISEDTVSLKSNRSHVSAVEIEQKKFSLDYGSATSDLTGKDADKDLDEATKFALLDGAVCKQTRSLIRIVLKDERLPITFMTGRIPSLGSLSGHGMARAESRVMTVDDASSVCLLWVDLFANMNPAMSSFADYLTRCPAAFLLHETFPFVPRHFPGFEWIRPWLSVKRAAFIGLQHPSDNEIRFLEDNHIYHQTADELASRGAEDSIGSALAVINPRNDLPIHLVINFFALDWQLATFNDSAVEHLDESMVQQGKGAILIQDVLTTLDVVLKTGRLGAVDIMEVEQIAPEDVSKATEVLTEMLRNISGHIQSEGHHKSFSL